MNFTNPGRGKGDNKLQRSLVSLTNEEFTIHPKTAKAKCPRKNLLFMDTDIKRPGEEEVTTLVDVFHGWSKHI